MDFRQIRRHGGVPLPGTGRGRVGGSLLQGVERGGQAATVQQGDDVAAIAFGCARGDGFHDSNRGGLELDGSVQFDAGYLVNAMVCESWYTPAFNVRL